MTQRSFPIWALCLVALAPINVVVAVYWAVYFISKWANFWEVLAGVWLILGGLCGFIASLWILRDFQVGPVTLTGQVVNRRTRFAARSGYTYYYVSVGTEELPVSVDEYNAVAEGDEISVKYWPFLGTVQSIEPFCPKEGVDTAWLTANVVALAQAISDECAYDRLPLLADALEEAGCQNTDILNHCRQAGEHGTGCKVIDLLLGKK
jgi:hypothetical protein